MACRLAPLVLVFAAASCCVILLGASAAASRPPAVYVVGGAKGWAVPPGNATDALNYWAIRHRFHVGDVLDFKYSRNDSVLLVRRGDYNRCSAASPVRRFTGGGGGGGGTRFTLGRPGLFYFIGGVPARCEAGQRMVVLAVDARSSVGAPTPAPAPAPGGMEDEEPPHAPSGDRPIPAWFKLFVAGGLGFVSGCFLAGVILWLCVNCSS